jgi:hypothetical protein
MRDHYDGGEVHLPVAMPDDERYFSVCMHADPVGTTTASMVVELHGDDARPLLAWMDKAVECVLAWVSVTQPIDRALKMARLGPTQYMEPGTKAIWEVRDDGSGTKFLARVAKENLDELLAEKRALQRTAGAPAFSTLKEAGSLVLDLGDRVRFHWQGLTREGTVRRRDNQGRWVVESAAENYAVPENAISDVLIKDPGTVQDYHKRVIDYYRDYGMPEDWIAQYEKQYSATK